MKRYLTQGANLWVTGDLKLTLRTAIVITTDNVQSNIVKSKYFPKRGTVMEVGGMISTSSRKNTVRDRRMDIHSETFSPESEGK